MVPTLLSVNNYYYRRGGAEAVFLSQNEMLQGLGWKVVPFAMKHAKNESSEHDIHFVDEIEFGKSYGLYKKMQLAAKVVYSLEAKDKITRCIQEISPDIAHLHNIYHHISPSILSGLKDHAVPVVMTLHDLKIACPAYKMLTHDGVCERCKAGSVLPLIQHKCIKDSRVLSALIALESRVHKVMKLYHHVDRFIVPSKLYLEKSVERGWDRSKFIYIPNCIDIEQFEANVTPGESFVFFGRLSEEKGIMTLLEAAKISGVAVDIVGEGELSQQARDYAEKHGVKAKFHGYQQGENLYALIRAARAVVLPSEWYENAPISILEAYALGKPVIGADIGGIPEMVKQGETGMLFPSGDSQKLADALHSFQNLTSIQLEDMGRQGRAWVETSFSSKQYQESLLQLYYSLGVSSA